jgi:hypothetical protein
MHLMACRGPLALCTGSTVYGVNQATLRVWLGAWLRQCRRHIMVYMNGFMRLLDTR